ncbi:hypothetical protein Nepgr_027248 [Nepenthes gracilis]|uniref:Uncharacterized protein n=1 Tax=Nepenthes gracilis TaxID=150966 RepID=A0AAD3T9L1_NEPGR|nr:hypothetical protein Nepgr_027248 [Nepenthes gracilis]
MLLKTNYIKQQHQPQVHYHQETTHSTRSHPHFLQDPISGKNATYNQQQNIRFSALISSRRRSSANIPTCQQHQILQTNHQTGRTASASNKPADKPQGSSPAIIIWAPDQHSGMANGYHIQIGIWAATPTRHSISTNGHNSHLQHQPDEQSSCPKYHIGTPDLPDRLPGSQQQHPYAKQVSNI